MPGSGETRPNSVFCAMPNQENTSTVAGMARTSSDQDRMDRPGRVPAGDWSAVAGSGGPRRDRSTQARVRG